MYATVEANKIHISVAEYYSAQWYDRHCPLSRHDQFEFEYGSLEIDVHRDGRKFLTGFVVDPRKFIVDWLKMRLRKNFAAPKRVVSVSMESDEHVELFVVKFLKARGFVIGGMEKDSILPEFTRHRGKLAVQGFEALDAFSVIRYLVKRFGYKDTSRIRSGDRVYDLKSGRRWKIAEFRAKRRQSANVLAKSGDVGDNTRSTSKEVV